MTLFEQAGQSNSKGGSPAEPLVLSSMCVYRYIYISGGLKNGKVFGPANPETKRLLGLKGLAFKQMARLNYPKPRAVNIKAEDPALPYPPES